jgi:hypothetical protein
MKINFRVSGHGGKGSSNNLDQYRKKQLKGTIAEYKENDTSISTACLSPANALNFYKSKIIRMIKNKIKIKRKPRPYHFPRVYVIIG